MYQRIDGEQWRHIWLVGDLHGCLTLLASALRRRHFCPWRDLAIGVGDLIDRGPDSPGCLSLLDKRWFRTVMGNHEQMALAALNEGGMPLWVINGGDWFLRLDRQTRAGVERHLQQCAALPLIIELRSHGRTLIIAHADYPAGHYAWQQPVDKQQVLWSRERISRHARGEGETISGADSFWFGHTPLSSPRQYFNQHYIDTGAVFGNRLTMVKVQ